MKSPACTQCRWGTGTTKDREVDTDAAKEARARLAAMMAERGKQDEMWLEPKLGTKPSDAGGAQLVLRERQRPERQRPEHKVSTTFYPTSDSGGSK